MPVLKGELVNEICREEPVCLKYSEGLVNEMSFFGGGARLCEVQ